MRRIAVVCLSLSSPLTGCRRPQVPPVPTETPAQEADRVLAIAQDLEKQGETRRAFAAYPDHPQLP
jgi:hypothetical protein